MAATLPSPPASRETTPESTNGEVKQVDLTRHLDELLEQYLEVLDQYTILREQLSKTLSDGFLSLASAQRTSNLGPGRRYGRDGYDGRMKASKRVAIISTATRDDKTASGPEAGLSSHLASNEGQSTGHEIRVVSYKPPSSSQQQSSPDSEVLAQKSGGNPDSTSKEDDTSQTNSPTGSESKPKKEKIDPSYRDPATWYSILVPQSLRQAQKHFSTSVEGPVPQLLHTISALQNLEDRIWAARKELGISLDTSAPTQNVALQASRLPS